MEAKMKIKCLTFVIRMLNVKMIQMSNISNCLMFDIRMTKIILMNVIDILIDIRQNDLNVSCLMFDIQMSNGQMI